MTLSLAAGLGAKRKWSNPEFRELDRLLPYRFGVRLRRFVAG
jgi:hypothetical protein